MNIGYDKEEIAQFKKELLKEGKPYIIVEDEESLGDTGQAAHFQFIGTRFGQEVIYDVLMTTLELEYENALYDAAMENVSEEIKNLNDDKQIEETIENAMYALEEEEAVQVCEQLNIDDDFDYGVGVDYVVNISEIDDAQIQKFIKDFTSNTLKLDKTMYSFTDEIE